MNNMIATPSNVHMNGRIACSTTSSRRNILCKAGELSSASISVSFSARWLAHVTHVQAGPWPRGRIIGLDAKVAVPNNGDWTVILPESPGRTTACGLLDWPVESSVDWSSEFQLNRNRRPEDRSCSSSESFERSAGRPCRSASRSRFTTKPRWSFDPSSLLSTLYAVLPKF